MTDDLTERERRRLSRLRKRLRGKLSPETEALLVRVARDMEGNSLTPSERMESDHTITPAQIKLYQALMQVASENEGKP
jgi:hypothetical protein